MAHSHVRNPAGTKRPRKTGDSSSDEASAPTSDSDYIIDGVEEEDEVDVEEMPLSPPPPAADGKKTSTRKKKDVKTKRIWKILEEENEKWIDEHEWNPPEPENLPMVETLDPSPDVVLPLLRFQKEWLPWALKQENSELKGGILADEMGMGKTIQAISLVLTARSLRSPSIDMPSSMESSSSSLPRTRATLVICPVVALIHWVWEIERYTKRGSARVLVYHGPKRNTTVYDFKNYDFVLTTYQRVEGDYRKYIMPPKDQCQYCGKMINKRKMKLHLQYYCVPNAKKTEMQAKLEEMKKVPWFRSIEVPSFGLEDEKGKGKKKVGWKKKVEEQTDKSLLHSVKWDRIILDEAHFIKHRCSNTARAVFALASLYKWALSGTPLQNRVGVLYSLVRFLQVYPYACYFCRDCDCNIFDYTPHVGRGNEGHDLMCLSQNVQDMIFICFNLFLRSKTLKQQNGKCINCPHANVRHFCWWNRYINTPIQRVNERRRAMILLVDRLLKSIVLRRTKKGRAAELALPPRIVSLRQDSLDKNEREFYEALNAQSRVKFDAYARDARYLRNNYAHIFDLLTQLQQAVDHPYLVVYSKTAEVRNGRKDDNGDCGICHDSVEDVVVTSCDHVFCKACLIDYSATLGNVSCPSCSKPMTDLTTNNISGEKNSAIAIKGYKRSGILKRLKIADFKTSTKIDALREEIRYMVEGDGSAKGIVFSQFTSFLDLINFSLQMSGIKCVQLEGSMSLAEIEKAINTFTEDGDCRIFLMSLKDGGVALNLTVASHVFLMDSWWNPAVERQAQNQIHRIGQYKPIRTVRFVIEDTIEARILQLREKKKLVFKGTVGDSKDAMAKLMEADYRFLFQI